MTSYLSHLECSECNTVYSHKEKYSVCPSCKTPLFARYGVCLAKDVISKETLLARQKGLWRWKELLPVFNEQFRLTLGEGDTPLLQLTNTGKESGLDQLFMKDEANNPTGSIKARGLCVALCRALELGISVVALPTSGNSAGALAAYAARAGVDAHIYMPKSSPLTNRSEVVDFGAHLHLVDGNIQQAGRLASGDCQRFGWFNLATFQEPYRVEGKKTIGLEICEQFNWKLPDWIIYPTGDGAGLVGMWKAFGELEEMGWIGPERPHLAAIQADGCAPLVKAFKENKGTTSDWASPFTYATGLNIPSMFAGKIVLSLIRASHGVAMEVTDDEIQVSQAAIAKMEGVLCSPEGAATYAGFKKLLSDGNIKHSQRVLLFNTASGLKYM